MKTNIKILIVDDNSPFTILVARYLKRLPLWEVNYLICNSAKDAIAKSSEFVPTVAIIDYILGSETGIDLISKLKENGCKAAFIMLTGAGSELAATEALRVGVNDYLSKNELTPGTLERSLLRILEHKKAEDALQLERDKLTLILESMRDGVYIVDQFNKIEYINSVIRDEFGPVAGRKCHDYFYEKTQPCPSCNDKKVFAGETAQRELYSPKNGKTYDLLDTPLKNIDGSISMLGILRDITDRKHMEEALKYKTSLIRLLQEITVTANEASTVNEAMQLCIDKVCTYTGWPVGHVYIPDSMGKLFSSKLWYLEKPRQFETFRKVTEVTTFDIGVGLPGRVLASGKPAWITDVTKDSNFLRARLATDIGVKGGLAFPVLEGKKVAAVLEFFSDEAKEPDESLLEAISNLATQLGRVTERKRAEEALRKSENRYREVVECTDNLITSVDNKGRFLYVNHMARKIFGISPEECIGLSAFYFVHADDREKTTKAFEKWVSAKIPGASIENRQVSRNGEVHEMLWTINFQYNASGKIGRINSIARDITERKRVEKKIKDLAKYPLENPNPVLRVGKDGILLFANNAASLILGSWGIQTGQLLPEDWRKIAFNVFSSGSNKNTEFECGNRVFSLTFSFMAGEDYVNIYGLDITQRKKADAERQRMQVKMFSSSKLATLGEISAGVAHEINQPLTYISGFAQLLNRDLREGPIDKTKLEEKLKKVSYQIDRIVKIINHLRTFGRQHDMQMERVDLGSILENTLLLLGERIRLRDIRLVRNIEKNLPMVRGNQNRLEQVFINLFQNSIDAFGDKKENTEIRVDISRLENREEVQIKFTDNGLGIEESVREKIFEPFFTTKEVGKGTGLGLSVIYGIIQEHEGDIACESVINKGTTFTVKIPLEKRKSRKYAVDKKFVTVHS